MKAKPQLHIMPIKEMCDWIRESGNCAVAVLVAAAYDIDQTKLPSNSHVEIFEDIDYKCLGRSITRAQASGYAEFIRSLPDNMTTIICACNAGESRSAALCAALCEYFDQDSSWIWDSPLYHPNMLVFERFSAELGLEINDIKIDELFHRNWRAFTSAIKRARGELCNDNP